MNLLCQHEVKYLDRNSNIDDLKFMSYYSMKISGQYSLLFDTKDSYFVNISRKSGTYYISVRMIEYSNIKYLINPDLTLSPDEYHWNHQI